MQRISGGWNQRKQTSTSLGVDVSENENVPEPCKFLSEETGGDNF